MALKALLASSRTATFWLCIPKGAAMAVGPAVGIEQAKYALRLRERNRAKENGIHKAENRGIAADAQRERQYHH